ncbi:hypothetical protein ANO11243_062440 [Dothideomycetidae sp. 11243]|nr:hypothetical protein ANO11243_062440 [fungal sp. No.11243]
MKAVKPQSLSAVALALSTTTSTPALGSAPPLATPGIAPFSTLFPTRPGFAFPTGTLPAITSWAGNNTVLCNCTSTTTTTRPSTQCPCSTTSFVSSSYSIASYTPTSYATTSRTTTSRPSTSPPAYTAGARASGQDIWIGLAALVAHLAFFDFAQLKSNVFTGSNRKRWVTFQP